MAYDTQSFLIILSLFPQPHLGQPLQKTELFFRSLNFVPNFGFSPARSLLLDQTFFVFVSRHALYIGGIWYLFFVRTILSIKTRDPLLSLQHAEALCRQL